ncbi:hypothetical protein HZS_1657 [Henneguya salminicola]|nr:hypothetical protein HZS_1657 [Henneguya salminicola]
MDDYSETEEIFLEEEDEDLYDKFNSLTFLSNTLIESNITVSYCIDFKFEKQLSTIYVEKCPNESLSNTSIQKSTNYSGDKIEDGTKISIYADSVIKLGIHPLLMLSDIHRRFFPMRHNESLTMGRYDPKTNAIKYLLFDSVIMNHEDKFYAMLEITRPFLFCDNAVTTGSRDFYYWVRY